jgi:uncharacterized cupredoxin-like copper-binding protein
MYAVLEKRHARWQSRRPSMRFTGAIRRIAVGAGMLVVTTMLVAACSSSATPTPTAAAAGPTNTPNFEKTGGGMVSSQALATPAECAQEGIKIEIPDFSFKVTQTTLKAGKTRFIISNTGQSPHQLEIKGPGVDEKSKMVLIGKCDAWDVDLQPGTYEVWCTVDAHKDRGEDVKFTVE